MNPTRFAQILSTVAVASIAAWSSWSHMVDVALRFGERREVAFVLPISVDGMLIVASIAMVDDQRSGISVRWSARIAFLTGVTGSIAANITAAQPTLGARIVAAWPAVALLMVVEMLSRARRTIESSPPGRPANDLTGRAKGPVLASDLASTTAMSSAMRTPQSSGRLGRAEHRRQHGGRTLEAALKIRSERPDASTAEIATQLGVTERHVRRLLTSAHPDGVMAER